MIATRTFGYKKMAVIHDAGSDPPTMHIDCPCGAVITMTPAEYAGPKKFFACPGSGCLRVFDNHGWVENWEEVL